MCLIIEKDSKVLKAKSDITCYKVLKISNYSYGNLDEIIDKLKNSDILTNFISAFQGGFTYTKGVVVSTEITKLKPHQHFSYFDDKENIDFGNLYDMYFNAGGSDGGKEAILKLFDVYSEGFHSAATIERIDHYDDYNEVICECVIPKGSLYYLNKSDLYISNKLVVNKIIKTNLDRALLHQKRNNENMDDENMECQN